MSPALKINERLSSPVTVIDGVGAKKAQSLAKLGILTLEDLFYFMPRRYEDRRNPKPLCGLQEGNTECAVAQVSEISAHGGKTEAVISDDTGSARVVWFTEKIAGFVRKKMKLAIYGQVSSYQSELQFTHPEFEILYARKKPSIIGRIFPVYPSNADFSQRSLKTIIDKLFDEYSFSLLKEFLPSKILDKYGMLSLHDAIMQIHNPDDENLFIRARNRLAFDEFFLLQTGIMMRKKEDAKNFRSHILKPGDTFFKLSENLPFNMTDAQRLAVYEILQDLEKPYPMNRLLQGDVGSGKTLVAIFAMTAAYDSGTQSAFMAPTEILAEQHYISLNKSLTPLGLNVALLTGSLKTSERRKVLDGISDGSVNIAVGTHALFSEGVKFHDLGLSIVDEQHRFGVLQRGELAAKGNAPHVLAMTATPIPRTLIMSVYGDLEVSVLKEMPPGRKKIKTLSASAKDINSVYKMVRKEISKKHQVYWVCPLIDEGERGLKDVTSEYQKICSIMPDLRISMIHGRLQPDEKARIMQDFSEGKTDILVSTVIIEVGVDVPNATMIIIQDAGQFGLSQLHQLRGRVGRGKSQSFCVLLEGSSISPEGRERISAMVDISDGFELSERDLIVRGPGEICGTHQHGVTDFRVADLVRDEKILTLARSEAKEILEDDPELKNEISLKREIFRRLGKVLELATTS